MEKRYKAVHAEMVPYLRSVRAGQVEWVHKDETVNSGFNCCDIRVQGRDATTLRIGHFPSNCRVCSISLCGQQEICRSG